MEEIDSNSTPQQEAQPERSYFQQRVFDEMGLSAKENKIKLSYDCGDGVRTGTGTFDIFSEDKNGNIRILVYSLGGWVIQYMSDNQLSDLNASEFMRLTNYYVTRKNPANIKEGEGKYSFPKGQGIYPFFPPNLLKKYKAQEDIDTLVLTEGYFKSMCASMHGFDIVGLGSITHYADTNTRDLHPDIKRLINTCHVRKVVLLYDGDCLNLSMKDFEKGRDLARRPKGFYNAILNTRDLLVDFSSVLIEFAYVRSEKLIDNPKGLDDLLLTPAYKDKSKEILKDLVEEDNNGDYFFRMNVRDQVNRLKKKFYLDSVDSFYKHWADVIGDKEFIFEKMVYSYDRNEEKVKRAMPLAIRDFIRVGDDYFEMIKMPNVRTGAQETKLVCRKKSTIIDDFGREQLKNILKYKAFINKPSHIDYKPVVGDCFNLYSPLNYEAEARPWTHIRSLMEHIFGEQIELGYDYMQLLYLQPMQILPILCLVSHERGTGKTSFLDLLREMFGNNAINVGNSEIASDFNALVSGKLLVGVDETALDDNVKVTERLKMLSTAKRAPMQRKGKDHEEVENFTKYVLCSNNETRFIYTQEDEIRFWVRKIDPIPKEQAIPDILPILCDEIPGFMSYLLSRKMHIKEPQSRMWFSAQDLETQALRDLKAAQQPLPIREIKEQVKTLFMDFPAEQYIISIKVLKMMVDEIQRMPADTVRTLLRTHLRVENALDDDGLCKTKYIKIPYYFGTQDGKNSVAYYRDKGKGFVFKAEVFLNEQELAYVRRIVTARYSSTPEEVTKPDPQQTMPI